MCPMCSTSTTRADGEAMAAATAIWAETPPAVEPEAKANMPGGGVQLERQRRGNAAVLSSAGMDHKAPELPPQCHRGTWARLERGLGAVKEALAAMGRERRRAALDSMSSVMRAELLSFMVRAKALEAKTVPLKSVADGSAQRDASLAPSGTHGVSLGSMVSCARTAKEATRRSKVKKRLPQKPKRASVATKASVVQQSMPASRSPAESLLQSGVKRPRMGMYQATICFRQLVLRSSATSSRVLAFRYRQSLVEIRRVVQESCEWEFEESLRAALRRSSVLRRDALVPTAHAGYAPRSPRDGCDLNLSFSAYVSAHQWVGKVDTPTTSSLEQVLSWRERLTRARQQGWLALRSAWVAILVEGRTSAPGARGTAAKQQSMCVEAAEAYVDAVWRRREPLRQRMEERRKRRAAIVDARAAASQRAVRISERNGGDIASCAASERLRPAQHQQATARIDRRFIVAARRVECILDTLRSRSQRRASSSTALLAACLKRNVKTCEEDMPKARKGDAGRLVVPSLPDTRALRLAPRSNLGVASPATATILHEALSASFF